MAHITHYGDLLVSADIIFAKNREEIFALPLGHLLHTIAHEMSHIKMFSDRYKYANSEFATDILAAVVTAYDGEHLYRTTNQFYGLGIIKYGYIRDDLYGLVNDTLKRHRDILYASKA